MTTRREFSWVLAGGAGLAALGSPGAPSAAAVPAGAADPTLPLPPPLDTARVRRIAVDGGDLPVWDSGGAGVPIVFVHATTGTAAAWAYQVDGLSRKGWRVIAYSRRGTAEATAPSAGLDAEVADLLAILDAVGASSCHVVGTASGGMVATRFAVRHPGRTASLTISCSVVALDDPVCAAILANLADPEFLALPSALKELSPSYRAIQRDGVRRWLEIEGGSAAAALRKQGRTAAQFRSAMASVPRLTPQDLAGLTCPVLLIYGGADMYSPPPLARRLATFFRRCRVVVLAEAGHAAHWEDPVAFNRELVDFLPRARRR